MPLPFLATFAQGYFSSKYFLRTVLGFCVLFALRSYSQGRKTTRERDLHGRVVLLTVSSLLLLQYYVTFVTDILFYFREGLLQQD